MTFKTRSPSMAPDYALYREGVATADGGGPYTTKEHGVNMADYQFANIQVLPAAGATPTIRAMFWSERAGMFIHASPDLTVTGTLGVPFEYAVPCYGRIMYVEVTGADLTGGVDIAVSGYSLDHTV